MKRIWAALASVLILAGCQEAAEYEPSIYITEAQREQAKVVTISAAGEKARFSISASQIVDRDTRVTVEVCPELLESYNISSGRSSILLDETLYDFSKNEATIKAGTNVSDDIEITMNQPLDPGKFYCLPLRIVHTDGSMPILASSSTLYLVLRAPAQGKGVYIGSGNKYVVPGFYNQSDLSALPEVTLECRVYVENFQNNNPYISSIMGLEGEVCLRFGDVKIDNNVFQVCKGDYQPAATASPCSTGKWYHVAGVWSRSTLRIYLDGQFVTEMKHKGETVNLSTIHSSPSGKIGFGLGCASIYQGNRPLDGYLAEARVWTRALSANEIANVKDLVVVDPQSPDLLAYWKMDECEKTNYQDPNSSWTINNKIVDQTGHGYDACGLSGNPSFKEATW